VDSPPRRHHYVPAFYLAQFTEGGKRESRLYVFDQSQIKSWPSTPDGTGHRKDFYAVDLGPETHPASFEAKVMSDLDGTFSAVVKKITSEKRMPRGDDLVTLLNFVATTMARNPRTRRLVDQVASHVINEQVKALVSTDEGWAEFLALSPECSHFSREDLQKYRQAILDDAFDIAVDNSSDKIQYNTWQVRQLMDFVDGALPLLAERNWAIGVAADQTPDFICSDTPVSLAINEDFGDSDKAHLANKRTTVFMPLSRRAALIGSYEKWPPTFQMSGRGVLQLNSLTICESSQVFSATEDFSYIGFNGGTMSKKDLVRALEQGPYKHDNLKTSLDAYLKSRSLHPDGPK
jgi:hypothetical protein